MNWCEGFKAMGTKVIVLPKHDFNYKLKLVSNEDCEKKFEFFLSMRENPCLSPLLSRKLCGSLLVDCR